VAFPSWRDAGARTRGALLLKGANIARRRIFELAAWQVLEIGKQWDQAHADVAEAIDFLEYYAREAMRIETPRRLGNLPGEENLLAYEPRGVAAVIAPWNFPLAISCGMTSAALAAGNCVIYKPSGLTPVTGRLLAEIYRDAGIPPGVFNFVPGRSGVIGDFLVDHPGVDLIAFTGSLDVGLRIVERAAKVAPGQRFVKRVICEMGGKNAVIVDEDADLDEAIPQIVSSAFAFQGQKCSACSRAIVLDAVYDRFVERFVAAVHAKTCGPPEDPANFLGPLCEEAAQRRVLEYIEVGKREGRLLHLGTAPESGYYVSPAVFGEIRPEHRLAREEIFGPVLAVMRAGDFDEALEWANSTR
jgi:RHH-type transcriptional regulator, proline utilization regulon repressor / proline dehydrogenase / delta 1-pyrroline-5-carboxylate dehydrogenase